jgi:cytochrome c-type biogenesis protein CcmH
MGWAALALIALAAVALLWRLRVARSLWTASLAALTLGATGYALQGRPGVAAQVARPSAMAGEVDPGLSELRLQMFGKYTYAETFFIASDGMIRAGSPGSAVRILRSGVEAAKSNAAVWTALGSAFAAHDGDTVSPAARLSFDRAMQLAPEHPGPPFFLGTAYVRAGDFHAARAWWARALALTPAEAHYRPEIATRLALLDRLLAMEAGAAP